MSNLKKRYIGLNQDQDLVIQEAEYIDKGFQIRELICGGFEILYTPEDGGHEHNEGSFATLKETLKAVERMKEEYT